MYKQLVTPNFDPQIVQGATVLTSWLGWCMAYVEQSIGLFYVYSKALAGWNNVKGRHGASEAVPRDVWLPLWFRGWVYRGEEQGHVLWAKFNQDGSGVAWTSPNSNKPYADKINFSSLANLVDQLKKGWASDIDYLGWSEYVGNKQIIERVSGMTRAEAEQYRNLMRVLNSEVKGWDREKVHKGEYDEREITHLMTRKDGIAGYSQQAWNEGGEYRALKDKWKAQAERAKSLEAENAELKKQLAETPTSVSDAENKLNMIKNALGIK